MRSRSLLSASRCRRHRSGSSGLRQGFGEPTVGAGKVLLPWDLCRAWFLLFRKSWPAGHEVRIFCPDTQTLLATRFRVGSIMEPTSLHARKVDGLHGRIHMEPRSGSYVTEPLPMCCWAFTFDL